MSIPANRKRFPTVFLGGLIILSVFIMLIFDTASHLKEQTYNNIMILGMYLGLSYWVILITLISFLDYIKKTFDKAAILTINENGIYDNLGFISVGNISWTEITNINIYTVLKIDFLVIGVTNPQSFIFGKNKLTQRTLKTCLNKFGSPIVISQNKVAYSLIELKEIILNMQKNNRH